MADRWPLANGNWSNAANWNGGTLPDVGDDVFADGKTVTIDQDVTVLSIRNTQRTGGTANGGFNFSTAQTTYNITADLYGFNATLINVNQGSRTYNFTGNIEQVLGATQNVSCVSGSSSSNIINITGNINSLGQAIFRRAIDTGENEINVIGNVSGGSSSGGQGVGIRITSGVAIVNITGNLTANSTTGGLNTASGAVQFQVGGATLNITGNVIANQSLNSGIVISLLSSSNVLQAGCIINIYGEVVAKHGFSTGAGCIVISTGTPITNDIYIEKAIGSNDGSGVAVYNDSTANVVIKTLEYSNIGTSPVSGKVLFSATNFSLIGQDENSNTVIFTEDNNVGTFIPAETDVRLNTTYYDGLRVGSLNVPDPSNVRNGVPTDNTVGTADLTAQDFFDAIANSSDPIAIRLRNVATVETTGDQISAFNV
jgi:hypothetical protein